MSGETPKRIWAMVRLKYLFLAGAAAFGLLLSGCGSSGREQGEADKTDEAPKEAFTENIAILLNREEKGAEAALMASVLADSGFGADIYYASGDAALQEQQVGEALEKQAKVLIIEPADPYGFGQSMENAQEKGIPVLSYKEMIMNTDAVSYYVGYNEYEAGQAAGSALRSFLEKTESESGDADIPPRRVELLLGTAEDDGAWLFYQGLMEEITLLTEEGAITIPSGRTTFDDTVVIRDNAGAARHRLMAFTEESFPDIILTNTQALGEAALSFAMETRPGLGTVVAARGNSDRIRDGLENGTVAFTLYYDDEALARSCAQAAAVLASQDTPAISDYSTYDNGARVIKTISVPPVIQMPKELRE